MGLSNFKYFVDDVEVFPKNGDDFGFTYEPNDAGGVVFDKELDGDLVFSSTGDNFLFQDQYFNDMCIELDFRIEQKCAGVWAIVWEGVFAVAEGTFDNDNCLFKIKPRLKLYLLDDVEVNFLEIPTRVAGSGSVGVTTGLTTATRRYPARYFSDVLLYVAQKSNPKIVSVISDLFQINPNVVSGSILGVTNDWTDMCVSALSDVQEPLPSNEATKEIITFKDLMTDLRTLFDAYWFIDSNYNLRVEHVTFFEGVPGLDLTLPQYAQYIKGTDNLTIDLADIPKQEIWRINEHDQTVNITYGGLALLNKNQNAKTYSTTKIRTDFRRIRNNGANSTDAGLFLFATDGGAGSGGSDIRMFEGNVQNIRMLPEKLVQVFHKYNRPSIYGLLLAQNLNPVFTHSGGIILSGVKAIRKQVPFSIPLCCTAFDSKNQITTPLGLGYLHKASYKLKTGMLKLELKYKVDNCSNVTPTDVEDCDLWLKRNTGIHLIAGFTRVSKWDDQSGNARDAVGVLGEMPEYVGPNNPISFFENSAGPATELQHLTTPSFQLFPSKRGTIFILFHYDQNAVYGGLADPTGVAGVISTFDGTLSNFFDVTLDASHRLLMNTNATLYPTNGVPTRNNRAPVGLFVIRRQSDDKLNCRLNGIPCIDNPMSIPNSQPTAKPLVIGYNPNGVSSIAGNFFLSDLIVYGRDLSDSEVEAIELYLTKSGSYNNIYPIA